jgi:hypothetical protein
MFNDYVAREIHHPFCKAVVIGRLAAFRPDMHVVLSVAVSITCFLASTIHVDFSLRGRTSFLLR